MLPALLHLELSIGPGNGSAVPALTALVLEYAALSGSFNTEVCNRISRRHTDVVIATSSSAIMRLRSSSNRTSLTQKWTRRGFFRRLDPELQARIKRRSSRACTSCASTASDQSSTTLPRTTCTATRVPLAGRSRTTRSSHERSTTSRRRSASTTPAPSCVTSRLLQTRRARALLQSRFVLSEQMNRCLSMPSAAR